MKQKLNIIKIGGNVIDDEKSLSLFLTDYSKLEGLNILVHGGGKKATEVAKKLQLEPKMIEGRRVTDASNLEVVTMVYAGLLNKNIVAKLQQNNCNAIGLSGADGNTIKANKRIVKDVDYGFAGDIESVDVKTISVLLENNLTPVFCAITHNKNGQLLNTNADTVASELASALAKIYEVSLTYVFEKKGVLKNINDENSIIENINLAHYKNLKDDGIIADGMLPKLENCFVALNNGVAEIHIANTDFLTDKNIQHTRLIL
ncbi:acetylglutamate kinase [Aureibaculum marinum]|uniref:Acetylglutamate kinase n=1 Tax=Aureibaculum marinum TaxID=2487930 RepID=A0A3N4NWK3_9FLAO|nr:acetylglutamate kinase [Aureibaculum marinum]RPE00226.1 acetylglutamate kinase [Aureibaculum marinum]